MRRSDGAIMMGELESIATHDENQMRKQLLVVLNDITDRTHLEKRAVPAGDDYGVIEGPANHRAGPGRHDHQLECQRGEAAWLAIRPTRSSRHSFARVVPPEKLEQANCTKLNNKSWPVNIPNTMRRRGWPRMAARSRFP